MPYVIDNPRPVPWPIGLGGEEGIVDAIEVLRGDAGAGVGHLGHHLVPLLARGDRQPAAARHGVPRVQEQVEEHLLELELVADHGDAALGQLAPNLDAALLELMLEQRQHVADDRVDVDHGAFGGVRGVRAGQVQQPVDDAGGAEGLLFDLLEHRGARVRRVRPFEQHLGVAGDAGQRRVDLVGDTRGQQAERRHLLGDAQLLFELGAFGDVLDDHDGAGGRRAGADRLQRNGRDVDEPVGVAGAMPRGERHPERRRPLRVIAALRAEHADHGRVEQPIDGLPHRLGAGGAVQLLERLVPPDDPVVQPEHHHPVVERLEDVLVERAQAIQFGRLEVQLTIEPAVLDGDGDLTGDRRDQVEVLGGQRLAALAAAEQQRRHGRALRDAGHEVVDARVAPELHFFRREPRRRQRVVQPHRLPGRHATADAGVQRQAGHAALHAGNVQRVEVADLRGQHERHGVDLDRLAHPGHQALGQSVEHDVGVQVAGKADQRAAVVVAIAVERAVDATLQAVLDGLGQQNHDDGGEEGDDPPLIRFALDERTTGGAEDDDEDRDAGRHRRGVDEQALEDDLDVHQPVAHDGRSERDRDEPERNGGQFHRQRRIHTQSEGHRIAQREGHRAERGPPDNPSQLTLARHRARARERAEEDDESGGQEDGEVQQFEAIEQADEPHEVVRVDRGADQRQHPGAAEHCGRQVDGGQPAREMPLVALVVRAFGEHQGEVQEQGRQEEQGDHVGPVEGPVHAIEAPAEREREDTEERHAQPEEVEGGLIGGPAGPDRRADQQREDADTREQVVQQAGAIGERHQLHLGHFTSPEPQQGVDVTVAGLRAMLHGEHLVPAFDRLAIDGEQDIARTHSGSAGR